MARRKHKTAIAKPMILAITRFLLMAAGTMGGYVTSQSVDWQTQIGLDHSYVIFLFIILGGAIGYVLGGIIGRELTSAWKYGQAKLALLSVADLVLATVGLIVGLTVAFLASQPLQLLEPHPVAVGLSIAVFLLASFIGVQIAMARTHEFVAIFPRFAQGTSAPEAEALVVLDTSAIIDGRFVEVRKLGFLSPVLRVPRFVLAELHTLSDSADDAKRARGRRGIDLLATLPETDSVDVLEIDYIDTNGVDEKLMRLAVDTGAVIITVDYNLTKVATVRGIPVLNLNELSASLRPNFLPGDKLRIKVTKAGKERGQGVGYLEDGTMVVISGAQHLVGRETDVEVSSVLQTAAGRMMFAKAEVTEPADDGPVSMESA